MSEGGDEVSVEMDRLVKDEQDGIVDARIGESEPSEAGSFFKLRSAFYLDKRRFSSSPMNMLPIKVPTLFHHEDSPS